MTGPARIEAAERWGGEVGALPESLITYHGAGSRDALASGPPPPLLPPPGPGGPGARAIVQLGVIEVLNYSLCVYIYIYIYINACL